MKPTGFPDLNGVLEDFVAGAREALGANFVGAYLGGSFAVGDADEHSDVDFIVVTDDEITDEQLARLQALHGHLYELDVQWAQHLEGSYVPRKRLMYMDPERAPFLFLDNGARELEWDNHCNTAGVRRVLRERGVTLAGPSPATLVAPVAAADLREEAHHGAREFAEWASEPTNTGDMSEWKQTYLVVTFCRILSTLATSEVMSKRAAGEWAAGVVDPQWRGLIERALADRPDPWGRVRRSADPELADRTLAFVEYAYEQTKGPLAGPLSSPKACSGRRAQPENRKGPGEGPFLR
jgi:predicted nucleotidyltransferase